MLPGTAGVQGVAGVSASPESPSPPQLLTGEGHTGGFTRKPIFPSPWLGRPKNAIKLAPGAVERAAGRGRLGSAGHKMGEDGDGRHRLPKMERGGDTALVRQAPSRKMSFK